MRVFTIIHWVAGGGENSARIKGGRWEDNVQETWKVTWVGQILLSSSHIVYIIFWPKYLLTNCTDSINIVPAIELILRPISLHWRLHSDFQGANSCWWNTGGGKNVGLSEHVKIVGFFNGVSKIGFPDMSQKFTSTWPSWKSERIRTKNFLPFQMYLFCIFHCCHWHLQRKKPLLPDVT